MSGTIPFPTDPQSLAIVGIGLVGGLWLLMLRSGAFRPRERVTRSSDGEQAS